MDALQHITGLVRKAVQDYEMIAPGDRILVGVSGGKDSVVLTVALARLPGPLLRRGGDRLRPPAGPVRRRGRAL